MSVSGWLGAIWLGFVAIVAVAAPLIAPGDPLDFVTRPLLDPFSDPEYPLGSDQLGRDVLAMLVHGARVSLVVGLAAAAEAIILGIVVGTLAGFLGGRADDVLMRVTEAFQTVPTFILALALVSALGASTLNVVIAIAISSWAATARLVRAEILSLRQRDYVDAARMAGMRPLRIAFSEVLPGALHPVVALVGVTVGAAILVESSLPSVRAARASVRVRPDFDRPHARGDPSFVLVGWPPGACGGRRRPRDPGWRDPGLVGESGCGKTTLARISVGLDVPDAGRVRLDGEPLIDAGGRVSRELRRRVQFVFQDAYASFNPRRTLGTSVGQPLRSNGLLRGDGRDQVAGLLESVGLEPDLMDRHPHMLSGGQLQRASIARALALEPDILVCDEPVASMDVSVRAQILNVLLDLWRDRGIGILFVSHDLGVVRRIAQRVAVMYLGRVVELGENEAIWASPRHPYTRSLAASIPAASGRWREGRDRSHLQGEPPGPFDIPSGCRFHPRCPIAVERCTSDDPMLRPVAPAIVAACHLADADRTDADSD